VVTALKRPFGVFGKNRTLFLFYCGAALIGAALVFVRLISFQFQPGTLATDHPFLAFVTMMILAGMVWTGFIWLIPKLLRTQNTRTLLLVCLGVGFALRALFLGSTPVYENDWNRYLWDGAVLSQGINPYTYSPYQVLQEDASAPLPLQKLSTLSAANNDFADEVSYPDLTTIYPPVAQTVFGLAALIKPFDLNALRTLFILIDGFTVWLLLKALRLYGREPLWAMLYLLNPLVIYAGFNAVHMEIILLPFLPLSLLLVKTRPQWAAVALGVAAAVKLWPLILAPILFRPVLFGPVLFGGVRHNLGIYLRCAFIVAAVFLLLSAPMLLSLGENSGLSVYTQTWQRSSFLFPLLVLALDSTGLDNAGMFARLIVAASLTGLSLWLGFAKKYVPPTLPAALLIMTLTLFLLSPTGYPWYALWFIIYLPFVPSYGAAFLLASLSLYYVRYAFWEWDNYAAYTQIIVPLQFGLPLLVIVATLYKYCRTAKLGARHV